MTTVCAKAKDILLLTAVASLKELLTQNYSVMKREPSPALLKHVKAILAPPTEVHSF